MEDKDTAKPESKQTRADGPQRRRYKRLPTEMEVKFREIGVTVEEESLYAGHTLNVSRGGAFLKTTRLYRPGTMLELKMEIVDPEGRGRQVAVLVKVAWVSRELDLEGMGVEFCQIDPKTRQAILAHAYRGEWRS